MAEVAQRFPIRYSAWNAKLFAVLGLPRDSAYLEVDDDSVRVRLGWGFTASVPRRSISAARRSPDLRGITAGAHGWRGRWLVNGSREGMVHLEVDPPVRAWTLAIPVSLSQLDVSLEDPAGFLAALGAPATS
jgi:hypothetical protein